MISLIRFKFWKLIAPALVAISAAPVAAQTPAQDSFATYMEAATALRDVIHHEQFDREALAFDLALETPDLIADRVDTLIATHIYAGALRGAEGTLRAGAGNSLDQALLLHSLLIDAGQEARIARAQLDDNLAVQLLAAATPVSRGAIFASDAAGDLAITQLEEAAGEPGLLSGLRGILNGDPPTDPLPNAIAVETDRIAAALGEALPDGTALQATLMAEARDYFWVQTRLFGTQEWQDLHTAFQPETAIAPDMFVAAPLPEELTHNVRVKFELEIREGDKLTLLPLMDELQMDTHTLARRPIVLTILPDGVIGDAETVAGALPDTTFHFPLLNGELAPRGVAFTADGLTASSDNVLLSNGMASVVASSAGKLSEAGGVLSSLGADEDESDLPPNTPLREVIGLWAVVTVQAPGAERQIIRRPLVDRIGAGLRAEGQVFAPMYATPAETAMLGQWMVMIQTGGIGQAELLYRQIDRLRDMAPAVAAGDDQFGGLGVSNPAMQAMMTALFDTAAEAGAALHDGWTYRGAPGVLITSQTYHQTDTDLVQRSAIDILMTGRRAIGPDGAPRPVAALAAGVAETLAERVMADAIAVNIGQPAADTAGSWDALTAATNLRPVTAKSALPEDAPTVADAMAAEIDRGQILAYAEDGPAWWRVDGVTGAAIGVDGLGNGGESAEYIVVLDAVITKTFVVYGSISCTQAGGDAACCLAANVAWGAVGFSIWGVVGKGLETFTRLGAAASGWVGLAAGAGMSGTGWNPYQGPC
ncbi:hypothetical protein [Loktanella sp. Alg231-35]|uniref:hypothetical protein n=1 Tax=Loktanella sp. Alg231-35 TaxID=1922220 RepID=UPI00131F377F|nr:hypothetical protein [Loktanella sp. Alg231-35]